MSNNIIHLEDSKASNDKRARRERSLDHYIRSRGDGFLFVLPYGQIMALLGATFEEKDAFVRGEQRRFLKVLAVAAVLYLSYSAYRYFVPAPLPQAPPPTTFEAAGTVEGIQLHNSFLSTSTTVRTTTGIYQVYGGVSAAVGDTTKIKREHSAVRSSVESSLCVESKIKSDCYSIY